MSSLTDLLNYSFIHQKVNKKYPQINFINWSQHKTLRVITFLVKRI